MRISRGLEEKVRSMEFEDFGTGDLIVDVDRQVWIIIEYGEAMNVRTYEVSDLVDIATPKKLADASKVVIGVED